MKTVAYVVGGCGFLGARLVDALVSHGARVGVVDPCAPGEGWVGRDTFAVRGLANASSLGTLQRELGAATHVFHLGGSGSVGMAAADPEGDRVRTVEATEQLLAHTQGRVVLVSSAAVYGDGAPGLIAETHACAPISTYGRHKLEAEGLVRRSERSHAVVRFFSIYGPGLRKQLLWDACLKLRRGEARFSGTGHELRDWLHVDDAVALLEAAARSADDLVLNGGTGTGTSVARVLTALQSRLGRDEGLEFSGSAREGDPISLVANIELARSLGWSPRVAIDPGFVDYVRWFELQSC
jgi:UDP-glucose 4-epimerase